MPTLLHSQRRTLLASLRRPSSTHSTRARLSYIRPRRSGVPRACLRVLVCVGRDVGDEFLGREREETGEGQGCAVGGCAGGVRRGGGGEAGEGEVVGCYCVWDLLVVSVLSL